MKLKLPNRSRKAARATIKPATLPPLNPNAPKPGHFFRFKAWFAGFGLRAELSIERF